MFELPNLDVAVRAGPVTVATTFPGLHVHCLNEAEEFLHRVLPDPFSFREHAIRPFVKPHVDALDELAHLVTEGREQPHRPNPKQE